MLLRLSNCGIINSTQSFVENIRSTFQRQNFANNYAWMMQVVLDDLKVQMCHLPLVVVIF